MRTLIAFAALAALVVPAVSFASRPSLEFSRNLINAGKVQLGEAADYDVILTNIGSEPVTLTTAEITPDPNTYISPSNCAIGSTLDVGQSCLFEVNIAGNEIGAIRGEFCWTAVGATVSDQECGHVIGRVTG